MKYFGVIFVVLGIAIIIYSIFASAQIFIYGENPPQIFQIEEGIVIPVEDEEIVIDLPIGGMINISTWLVFAAFLVFAGSKLSFLGIQLLRYSDKKNEKEQRSYNIVT